MKTSILSGPQIHQSVKDRDHRRTKSAVSGPCYSGEIPPWKFARWQWETPEQKVEYSIHINAQLRTQREMERQLL